MLWLRNVDALASEPPAETLEAELASEAEISGLLDYAGEAILCGRATFQPDDHGLYKYVLKLKLPPAPRDIHKASREGYLFREGPVGELVALFSLKLQARIFILSTRLGELTGRGLPVKSEYSPQLMRLQSEPNAQANPLSRNFASDVSPFLDQVRGIPPKHHLRVALAANHYARALRELVVDGEMVYVRLVSAIETAARHQPVSGDLFEGKSLADLIRTELLSENEREELERTFGVRKAKARFVTFLREHSEGFFKHEPREPAHTQVTPESLTSVATSIYNARSGYLHGGSSMYLSGRIRAYPQYHMDPSVGMIWQNRRFSVSEKLPHVRFFERLVRHCLLEYIGGPGTPPAAI